MSCLCSRNDCAVVFCIQLPFHLYPWCDVKPHILPCKLQNRNISFMSCWSRLLYSWLLPTTESVSAQSAPVFAESVSYSIPGWCLCSGQPCTRCPLPSAAYWATLSVVFNVLFVPVNIADPRRHVHFIITSLLWSLGTVYTTALYMCRWVLAETILIGFDAILLLICIINELLSVLQMSQSQQSLGSMVISSAALHLANGRLLITTLLVSSIAENETKLQRFVVISHCTNCCQSSL